MGSHSAVTTSPGGNRHLMSPTAPRFHTQGLLPWRPSPEAPALPGRLGISEPFTSAVSLSLLLTLLQCVKYNLCGREGGTGSPREGGGGGESPRGVSQTLLQGVSFLKPGWPLIWWGRLPSPLFVTEQVLMELEKDVCVCVLPSQNRQVPRGVLIRKPKIRLGDSRHLASDRCCSRCLSALFSFHNRSARKMLLAHLTDVNSQAPRSNWLRLYRAGI